MSHRLGFHSIVLTLLAALPPTILNDCLEENFSSGPQQLLPLYIALLSLFHFYTSKYNS